MQNAPIPGSCGTGSCLEIVQDGDRFAVRSTRYLDAPALPADADEVVKFIREVKAGDWDAIEAAAQAVEAKAAPAGN